MSPYRISEAQFPSPVKTMGILLITLFGIEMIIMQALDVFSPQPIPYFNTFVDSFLLTALFSPILYHYIFKPFQSIAATQKSMSENVLAHMVDGVILFDELLVIHSFNEAAERIFGYSSTEVIGGEVKLILKDASLQHLADMLNSPARPIKKQTSLDCTGTHRNGTAVPIEFSLSRVQLGESWMWLWIIRDVTEQKNLEHQLRHAQKMEALGTLAGGVAHDFNNILTVVMGFCNLSTAQLDKDSPLKNNLDQIMAASHRAITLTNSLLAYSRKQAMNPSPRDLNGSVRGIEKFLARLIGEDIELIAKVCEEPLVVMADGGQIEQVLMNLATNARDAMTLKGCLIIETRKLQIDQHFISMHGYGKPGTFAQISVSDTGAGMDEQTKEKVFEPFFTTKQVGQGTGLGLSIVYGIIKQHEGYINIYSEPGKGTTFNIYLPLVEGTRELLTATKQQVPGGTETILLAEDDDGVRALVEIVLTGSGYQVLTARDGKDAVQRFQENLESIDLLVLDVVMPKKNGKETLEEICAIKPNMKAIFISGYTADILDKNGLMESGESWESGLHLITKPLQAELLLARVREVLDSK